MPQISIAVESPDQPEVIALLEASDIYTAALYPAESNFLFSLEELQEDGVSFLVARLDGEICGCAAFVKKAGDWGEIKRMFVDEKARGHRLGKRLLEALEDQARRQGMKMVRLETGIHQPEALSLYRGAGYVDIGPFGDYPPDPVCVFMEKKI